MQNVIGMRRFVMNLRMPTAPYGCAAVSPPNFTRFASFRPARLNAPA